MLILLKIQNPPLESGKVIKFLSCNGYEEEVVDTIKKEIKYYIIVVIVFYLLPLLLIKDTGGAMFSMLILIPLLILVISCIYGMKNGFHIRYALIVALLFTPSIYVIYNESAWIYTAIYGAIALIGNLIGLAFRKTKNTD